MSGAPKPFFNDVFHISSNTYFDALLIYGSAVFSLGWDLGGFCIGPAVATLPIAATETNSFVVGIMIGTVMVKYFGLWCDYRAWDLVEKRQKIAVNNVTAG